MNGLIEFFTTEEMLVVYALIGMASILYFIVYLFDKTYDKRRQRQNTRELKKITEQLGFDEIEEDTNSQVIEPVLLPINEVSGENNQLFIENISHFENKVDSSVEPIIKEAEKIEMVSDIDTILQNDCESTVDTVSLNSVESVEPEILATNNTDLISNNLNDLNYSSYLESDNIIERNKRLDNVIEKLHSYDTSNNHDHTELIGNEQVEVLQYTDIEPDQTEAQAELLRLTESLEQTAMESRTIELTAFEEEQEQNAIISLDELMTRGKLLYESGEIEKLEDEGNEPISIQDLEERKRQINYNQPVESLEPVITNVEPIVEQMVLEGIDDIEASEQTKKLSTLDSIDNKDSSGYQGHKKFQSSPIISPVYGIAKTNINSVSDIELENTANYEKLDEEIRKTNEFLMTLKELQQKLD